MKSEKNYYWVGWINSDISTEDDMAYIQEKLYIYSILNARFEDYKCIGLFIDQAFINELLSKVLNRVLEPIFHDSYFSEFYTLIEQ